MFSETAPLSRAAVVHAPCINGSLKHESRLDSRKVKIVIGRLDLNVNKSFWKVERLLDKSMEKLDLWSCLS